MSQPRRPDEIAYYAALRHAAVEYGQTDGRAVSGYWGGNSVARRIAVQLGMPENRAFYLLCKWSAKGWIDWGTWAWGGWFTEQAPAVLSETASMGSSMGTKEKAPKSA